MWTMFSVCTVSIFYYALPTFHEVQRKYLAVEGNSYASVLACDWLTRNGLGVFRGFLPGDIVSNNNVHFCSSEEKY